MRDLHPDPIPATYIIRNTNTTHRPDRISCNILGRAVTKVRKDEEKVRKRLHVLGNCYRYNTEFQKVTKDEENVTKRLQKLTFSSAIASALEKALPEMPQVPLRSSSSFSNLLVTFFSNL